MLVDGLFCKFHPPKVRHCPVDILISREVGTSLGSKRRCFELKKTHVRPKKLRNLTSFHEQFFFQMCVVKHHPPPKRPGEKHPRKLTNDNDNLHPRRLT